MLVDICTTWFNMKELWFLPIECVYVFCMTLTVKIIVSLNSINL